MTYAIEARNLRKQFGSQEVVRGINLTVKPGELFALLGPNGAGKTTTIHMLTTLLRPDGGFARIFGSDTVTEADEVRNRISVTGQYAALDETLTGSQNLMLFAGLYGYTRRKSRLLAEELLEAFGLQEAGERVVGTYSGGMRRRLDLAVGILSQPQVLFLDEPTTGLDPLSRRELWEKIRLLVKQGTTVLLTTQYLEEADQLADRIGFITNGKLIAVGTPDELKASVGGKIVTIQLDSETAARDACGLIHAEHDLNVQHEQGSSTVKLAVPHAAAAHEVIGTLFYTKAAVADFMLSDPSLDDVYFALTAASGEEGEDR